MSRFAFSRSALASASVSLMLLLVLQTAIPPAFAQERERSTGDSYIPLVYPVRNTAAYYRTPEFPSFDRLPIIRPLPDPFRFIDGRRDDSFAGWERHRNEIMAAVQKYEIGPVPDCADCAITASYAPPATPGSSGTLTVNVTRNGTTITLTSGVYIPQGTGSGQAGPYPALIPMAIDSFDFNGATYHFPPPTPPNYGSLPASVFQGLPIATINYVSTQVAGYCFSGVCDHTKDAFYQLYPELCAGACSSTSNSGIYAAWTWGVSRLIDGIEIAAHQSVNPLPIDTRHLAVTGCSFAGKMALFAGAFDERIALTIAQENGGGGAPSWRVSHEIEPQGSVEDIDDTSYDWFAGQMHQFAGDNVYKLPIDHHELEALVAPRALLETGNTDYYWLSNRSNYVSARATQRIYDALGIGDRFGFYIDGGHAHCATLPAEAPAIAAFVSKFLLAQAGVDSDVEVAPYPNLDYERWTWWWRGAPNDYPRFPNNWNTGGTLVMALDPDPRAPEHGPFDFGGFLKIVTGDTVEAGFQFLIPGNHPDATASLVNGSISADVRCLDGSSYTLAIPLPANQSYSIPAGDAQWVPGPQSWQGSVAAPACGRTSLGIVQGAYFSALNVSTGVGNPPTGTGLTTSDPTDPLVTRFSLSASGPRPVSSEPVTVNFNQ